MANRMLTRRYLTIFTIILWLLCASAQATVVKDLYSATIPVTNQRAATRLTAIHQAFMTILVKVSGNSRLATLEPLQSASKLAENYVQQYSFLKNADDSDSSHPYLLNVNFVPNAINSLLLRHNIPVWGRDRPLILFWVSHTQTGHSNLVGANSQDPLANMIDQYTDARGIPAILPLLDLSDLKTVSASDVQAPFVQVLQAASSRYGSNAMVILRVNSKPNNVLSRWTLVINDVPQSWQVKANDLKTVINKGTNQVADILAAQFAVAGQTQQSEVDVHVSGLASLTGFARARDYLQRLAPVKSASILQITTDGVTFQLQLVGSVSDLQKAITLDHTLRVVSQAGEKGDTTPETSQPMELNYQWNR